MPTRSRRRPQSAHSSTNRRGGKWPDNVSSSLNISLPSSSGGTSFQEYLIVEEKTIESKKIERQHLPLRSAQFTLEKTIQRPSTAGSGRRSGSTNNQSYNKSSRNSNENRRRRLQRLIQLSSGQRDLPTNQEILQNQLTFPAAKSDLPVFNLTLCWSCH